MIVWLSVDSMDNVYLRYLFIQDTKLYWIYILAPNWTLFFWCRLRCIWLWGFLQVYGGTMVYPSNNHWAMLLVYFYTVCMYIHNIYIYIYTYVTPKWMDGDSDNFRHSLIFRIQICCGNGWIPITHYLVLSWECYSPATLPETLRVKVLVDGNLWKLPRFCEVCLNILGKTPKAEWLIMIFPFQIAILTISSIHHCLDRASWRFFQTLPVISCRTMTKTRPGPLNLPGAQQTTEKRMGATGVMWLWWHRVARNPLMAGKKPTSEEINTTTIGIHWIYIDIGLYIYT